MKKEEFNRFVKELLKNKAMTTSEIKDAILNKHPNENKNTIKSMILRSKLLRSSAPMTFDNGCYAYTLKVNRNYSELFLKLANDDINTIKFIKNILNEEHSFLSLFSFNKLLQIKYGNLSLMNTKIDVLRFYKDTIEVKDGFIYSNANIRFINQNSEFFNRQKTRLLVAKILLYKHNSENLIEIKKANYLGMTSCSGVFHFPKPLFNIYFDAYAKTPSYVKDLNKLSYAVYDFAINDEYSYVECKSFISRVLKLKAYGAIVIPICVYKTIKPNVKELLKSSGIIGIKYSSFLGKGYEDILNDLNTINSENDLDFSFDQFKKLISSLDQIDLLEQTKGYLFEYACYRFLNDYYGVRPVRNVVVPKKDDNPGAQFDMIICLDNETIVCECKATTAGIGFGNIDKANIYTISHTIAKMSLLDKPNKKMLYFVTSYYKKIGNQNANVLSQLIPQKTPTDNECLYTLDGLISLFPDDKWLATWRNFFKTDNK